MSMTENAATLVYGLCETISDRHQGESEFDRGVRFAAKQISKGFCSGDVGARNGGESAHTPGPWQISGYHANGCGISNGVRGVASAYGIGADEAKANGRLIAAAPELLEALKRCKFDSLNMTFDDLAFCRAAYLKATTGAQS